MGKGERMREVAPLTRDDEAGHAAELLHGADFHRLHAGDMAQEGHVLAEGALEGQHADPQLAHRIPSNCVLRRARCGGKMWRWTLIER